jgi:hypothetical protein
LLPQKDQQKLENELDEETGLVRELMQDEELKGNELEQELVNSMPLLKEDRLHSSAVFQRLEVSPNGTKQSSMW